MAKSLKKNYIYNVIYQILLLVVPLITTPYVSRVLSVDGIGLYSYANSIVSYFVLVATLGTTTFGQRQISYNHDNKEELSRAFWELFIFRTLTSAFTLAVYFVIFTIVYQENQLIYLIFSLNIINVIFDISWFFQGLEEFGKTVLRNIIFKILSVVAIFVFVRTQNDLWLYVLFMIAFTVLGNLTMWLYLPKYLCKVKGIRPFRDTKSIIQFFIPTVATQIYTVLDKSMIGWFTDGTTENGYYEQAEKISKIALAVVTSLGTVMIPRISKVFKDGNIEKVRYYLYKSYRFVWMLSIPIMFGLVAISDIFVPVFLGDGYEKCEILIPIFSLLTIIIGLSNVNGMQLFVPTGRQNILTLTVVVGAIVNIIFNLILIPLFASIGACIASVIAEFCVTLVGFIYIKVKDKMPISPIFKSSIKYWIAGTVMFGALIGLKFVLDSNIIGLVISIISGILIYFILLFIMKDSFLYEICRKALHRKTDNIL